MGRAERRRLEKQKGKQVKTYNLTRSQLHNAVRQVTEEDLKRIKQEAMEDAINTAMTLLLVLPMEVLMDHYWKKTYAKKIPEFTGWANARACDGRWSMLDAMNSISVISMVYEVKPLFFRGRVREALWRKLRDQYLNMEAEIEIER